MKEILKMGARKKNSGNRKAIEKKSREIKTCSLKNINKMDHQQNNKKKR